MKFEDLDMLQEMFCLWEQKNFGQQLPERRVLGAVEEVGELAHCFLKRSQGIRGMDDPAVFDEKARDAVGDTVIYLLNLCNAEGWRMSEIIQETAEVVLKRDWIHKKEW